MPLGFNSARYNSILWQNRQNLGVKKTLPSLTVAAFLAGIGAALWFKPAADAHTSPQPNASPQREQGNDASGAPAPLTAPAANQSSGGNQLLLQAAERVGRYATIQAKIRQRAELLGRQLVGSGTYRQLGHGLTTRLRFELRMQANDMESNLLAVCDGKNYWRHTDYGGRAVLERVDVARVQKALEEKSGASGAGQGRAAGANLGMPLGGLPAMLAGLAENFDFPEVEQQALERLPVSVLRGTWKQHRLADLVPRQRAAIMAGHTPDVAELPAHAPHRVVVYLGRDDLFPYRIEYLRYPTKKEPGYDPDHVAPRPVAVLELFEVQANAAIPEATFQYQATGRAPIDVTEKYLR
jgi:hypothetical protein